MMSPSPPKSSKPLYRRPEGSLPEVMVPLSPEIYEPEAMMAPVAPESSKPSQRRPVPEKYRPKRLEYSEVDIAPIEIKEPVTQYTHSEVHPIILQYMAKSTLRAVLTDKNALASTAARKGIDTNDSELVDKIFCA